ncbi:MAG: glutathione S-transferase family protein [Kordiimonadaceae bacterium]|nr:glutathione S-transferase family protein [Kordiimonadaceae bacterium]MBO6569346.1 glutathione S-transferase family protein [Kordiimonadaceae bacterium]MBO6964821.1 glutathione S-transferase family protein [Kordiimonadaceae bacterium]
MKLYDYTLAPNPRRVRIFLAEKGIDVPLESIDIRSGGARAPEFLEKNSFGGIPVLELDDCTCISESVAICRYFEEMHPEPPLFGTTAVEKANIEMWLRRVELGFMVPTGMVWLHGNPLTAKVVKQIPEVADQYRERIHRAYALFDQQLADHTFFSGNAYSVVDAVALASIDFARGLVGEPFGEDLEHLSRWHEDVSNRDSAMA